jgi:pimeloyl-ACP methyl ester carboxylesterase
MTSPTPAAANAKDGTVQAGYALLGDLQMYYEIHGAGEPLVLLHGGFMNIDAMEPLLPALAQRRQVIAPDLEGHGRTTHLDRPLHYTHMADGVADLLRQLGIEQADVVGFSMGGMAALRLAMRHPNVVRRLVAVSSPYSTAGFYPAATAGWPEMSAEGFVGTPMEQSYLLRAPHPERWPAFVNKMREMMMSFDGWSAADIASIKAPTLLVVGDADLIRPEHTIELLRMLGGAREDGGMGELPAAQLAVLPHTTHFNILDRVDLLLPIVLSFLNGEDAPASMGASEQQEQTDGM